MKSVEGGSGELIRKNSFFDRKLHYSQHRLWKIIYWSFYTIFLVFSIHQSHNFFLFFFFRDLRVTLATRWKKQLIWLSRGWKLRRDAFFLFLFFSRSILYTDKVSCGTDSYTYTSIYIFIEYLSWNQMV